MSPVSRPVFLPHPLLPDADWADRFTLRLPAGGLTARHAARLTLERPPLRIRAFLVSRNRLVAPFGWKKTPAEDGATIGGIPVISAGDDRVVLGADGRHLDFRIVIDVRQDRPRGQTLSFMTLLRRRSLPARLYLAAVLPFHKYVLRGLLAGIDRPWSRERKRTGEAYGDGDAALTLTRRGKG